MTCGVGGWGGPLPGDPSNDAVLAAIPAYGGIDLSWSYPSTNPWAVAYVKVYRSLTNNQASAIKIGEAGGNRYFDALDTVTTAFYWIQLISVNGSVLALIGPASATSMLTITKTLEDLSGRIDDSFLASLLRTKIDKIPLLETNLADEINARLADNASLATVLGSLTTDVNGVAAAIIDETNARIAADSAQIMSLDALAITVGDNTAAILTEAIVRADAVGSLASRVEILEAMGGGGGGDFNAAITVERNARIAADEAVTSSLEALIATRRTETADNLAAAISTESSARVNADGGLATSISNLQTTLNTKIGTDIAAAIASERTVRVNAEDALSNRIDITQASITDQGITLSGLISSETLARTNADGALANSITTLQTTLGEDIASVRTDMSADILLVDGKATAIGARWTAVVDVNGLVGGFGVYNDGSTIAAGFNVDEFWVGRATDKIKPFIISGGTVYIKDAVIPTLAADKIDTRGLLIRNATGDVIFGAGATVDPSAFMAVPSGWLNTNAIATAAADATAKADAAQAAAIASANIGLATKLSSSGASVLSGVLSLDAAAASGLRVGNLVWNTAGARTSGYGVAITPYGLIGYNPAGTATFLLNAATGSLTMQGDISGSTGTFVGSVSVNGATWSNGATGFFAGIDSGLPRFRVGTSLKGISWDGDNDFRVIGDVIVTGNLAAGSVTDSKLGLSAFTATIPLGNLTNSVTYGHNTYGTRSVSVSGGTPPYSYFWTVSDSGYVYRSVGIAGSASGSSVTVQGSGDGTVNSATVTCLVKDSNGRVTFASFEVTVDHSSSGGGGGSE